MTPLATQIEAILFWKAEPVSAKKLLSYCSTPEKIVTESELSAALDELKATYDGGANGSGSARGIALIEHNGEIALGTSPEVSNLIERLTKDELMRDLGKAGLETLSIILYQGPISRSEIDYIRGVNSQFIVRNLLVRGLIERKENTQDQRSFLYSPTLALLAHLGISNISEIPEYATVKKDIETFKTQAQTQ